jgi:hypothetical protein
LYEGGAKAVSETKDPMIELARLVDPTARKLRKEWEAHEETRQQAHGIIEKARFAIEGPTRAPDATFTLRLSYGPVKGYNEAGVGRHQRTAGRGRWTGGVDARDGQSGRDTRASPRADRSRGP